MKTKLRPHKVLTKRTDSDVHALTWTDGKYAGMIFNYTDVGFQEDKENDKLKINFGYNIDYQPTWIKNFDKAELEQELGDFLVDLIYYGLERDYLGMLNDDDSKDNSIKFDSQ